MNAAKQRKVDNVVAALEGKPFGGYFAPDKATFGDRILRKLFPTKRVEPPDSGYYMRTDTEVRFDWVDRIRVLVSGHVRVEVLTETDVTVSCARSRGTVYVAAPSRKKQ